jgi:signal-transduction protein with cAMP-binding, CBS, and nucleotidyltransferase domain
MTSQDHPEANELAKRMVQTVKQGLQKYGFQKCHIQDWDL